MSIHREYPKKIGFLSELMGQPYDKRYLVVAAIGLLDAVTELDSAEGFDVGDDTVALVSLYPHARHQVHQRLLPHVRLHQEQAVVQRHRCFYPPLPIDRSRLSGNPLR